MKSAAALCVWALAAWGAPSHALTLADAVEAAWQRGTASVEAASQARQTDAERRAASAPWAAAPAVELGTQRNRQRATGNARDTEVGLAVPLWLPGQRRAMLEQVDADAHAAAAQAAAARLRIAGVVREAAAEVALQRADLLAAQAQYEALEALARDVDRRVAAGDLPRADAMAAQAERLAAATALSQARQRLQSAQLHWQALTGMKDVPPPGKAPAAVTEHPDLIAARRAVQASEQRLQRVQRFGRDAPELLLSARQELAPGEPRTQGVGVALRLPLDTDDRNRPRRTQAEAELERSQARARELRQQIEAEQASAELALAAARQQLTDESERAQLLRDRAALIEKSFQAGETALPEMLRALTAASQAQASQARAQAALAQAFSRLQQAQGVLP